MRVTRRQALLGLAGLGLSGCDLFEETDPPLPGQRIPVLSDGPSIEASSALAGTPIRLPPPYVNGSWSQPGGSPAHAMYHLALGDLPQIVWSDDVGSGDASDAAILSQPVVFGDAVFTMDARAKVTAFRLSDGELYWQIDLTDLSDDEVEDDGFFGGGLAFDAGRVFVTTGFAKAFALDGRSGRVEWSAPLPAPVRAAPVATAGRVFVLPFDNQSLALDQRNGGLLWRHRGIEEEVGLLGTASPAVSGDVVVVPYSSGELYGLTVGGGRPLWSESLASLQRRDPLSDIGQIRGLPVIDRGLVYATSNGGRTLAVDLRRGTRLWEQDYGGAQTPWAAGDYVYLITNQSDLTCVTRSSGAIRWVTALPRFEDPENRRDEIGWLGPVLASDRLIVANSLGEAYAISPYSGEILGVIDLPAGPAVAPVVVQEYLLFLATNADLVVMR